MDRSDEIQTTEGTEVPIAINSRKAKHGIDFQWISEYMVFPDRNTECFSPFLVVI